MNKLREQVARAQRHLVIEQFVARSVWCLLAAFGVAALAIAVPRIFAFPGLPESWDQSWLIGSLGIGLLAAGVWTFVSRRTTLDAALEIDRRFNLRERVASSISLSPAELATEAGRALVNDAVRFASRIDIGDKFHLQPSRYAWLPLIPAAVAFLLTMIVSPSTATSSLDPSSSTAIAKQISTAAEAARKKLAEQRLLAQRSGLKEAEEVFKKIEAGTRDLAEEKDLDRTKAAVKLNDLARELDERRKRLGGTTGLQKQLQNLNMFGSGAAAKLAQAMQQGDLSKAAEDTEKLARELRAGKLDPQDQQQLAEQLDAMQRKLAATEDSHQQSLDNLKQQIEQQRQQGNLANAGEMQQKLDQLTAQQPQMQQLQELNRQMGQTREGLEQGNQQQAAEALSQMGEQLDQMRAEANEKQMLEAAMEQLQMAKEALACNSCQGSGCQECSGKRMSNMASKSNKSDPGGKGIGTSPGDGRSSKDQLETSTQDLQVRQRPGRGSAVYAGTVAGPNIKGEVQATIQQEVASFGNRSSDPLTADRLPRNRREHAEEYFNLLREGK